MDLKLSRDSALLWVGIVTAIVLALATLKPGPPTDPMALAYYGIPATWAPFLRLLALVVGIVSAKLSTSPLRSKAELQAAHPRATVL
jgi:hypothetical protein